MFTKLMAGYIVYQEESPPPPPEDQGDYAPPPQEEHHEEEHHEPEPAQEEHHEPEHHEPPPRSLAAGVSRSNCCEIVSVNGISGTSDFGREAPILPLTDF